MPSGTPHNAQTCCTKASNYGWRYALFCFGAISVGAFLARCVPISPNHNSQVTKRCVGLSIIRFLLFNFRESPRFLISQGRDAEAVQVVHEVARTNGRTSTLALDDLQAIDDAADAAGQTIHEDKRKKRWEVLDHLKTLFATRRMAKLTLLTWVVYAADYW